MEFKSEQISPVEVKVDITVSPDEVDAALKAAAMVYKSEVQLDGFRKGKVPLSVIEKRFHERINKEAHDDLINVHINEIIQKLDKQPVSEIRMEGEERPLEKGKEYKYRMNFETMPDFDMPNYEGLEVTQTRVEPSEQIMQQLLEKLRKETAKIAPVDGNAPAKDGQIVNLDFEAYENGVELKDIRTSNFELELGRKQALPAFEEFIKEIPVGHTAEKEIEFPQDFIAENVAGKKLLIKATVHAVKERKFAEIDDKFAKSVGKKDLEDLKKSMIDAYSQGMEHLYKAEAQQKLLNIIVKQTDFPLPPSMVKQETSFLAFDQAERLARQGKRAFTNKEEMDKFLESFKEPGEARTREKIILLNVAKKENLEVPPKEMEMAILDGAHKTGMDPQKYYEKMQENGLIFQLHENLLCDRAMDLIYERAKVEKVAAENEKDNVADSNNE